MSKVEYVMYHSDFTKYFRYFERYCSKNCWVQCKFQKTWAQFKMRSLLNRKMFIILNQILVKIFLLDINRQRHFKTCDLSWVWNYFHKTKLRKTKLNVWPRVTLSISCKAKISKHVRWWTALVSCARGQKLVRYYLIYDHEFTSLILPTLKYQSILHVRKWTAFLSSACGQKTRQNTSLYMLQV